MMMIISDLYHFLPMLLTDICSRSPLSGSSRQLRARTYGVKQLSLRAAAIIGARLGEAQSLDVSLRAAAIIGVLWAAAIIGTVHVAKLCMIIGTASECPPFPGPNDRY